MPAEPALGVGFRLGLGLGSRSPASMPAEPAGVCKGARESKGCTGVQGDATLTLAPALTLRGCTGVQPLKDQLTLSLTLTLTLTKGVYRRAAA